MRSPRSRHHFPIPGYSTGPLVVCEVDEDRFFPAAAELLFLASPQRLSATCQIRNFIAMNRAAQLHSQPTTASCPLFLKHLHQNATAATNKDRWGTAEIFRP